MEQQLNLECLHGFFLLDIMDLITRNLETILVFLEIFGGTFYFSLLVSLKL